MLLLVFLAALATALATGLGAAPFLLFRKPSRAWLDFTNVLASVTMLAATGGLIVEGARRNVLVMLIGALAGALFVAAARKAVSPDAAFGALRGADARKALLVVGVMTVHSVAEGIGVGAAFGGGEGFGVFVAVAIALHNIPEGLAISLVLIPRGSGVATATGWSVFSSLPQPLLAVPAFLFVEQFETLLPAGLGFAGGAMAWLVFAELVPETARSIGSRARARRSRRREAPARPSPPEDRAAP